MEIEIPRKASYSDKTSIHQRPRSIRLDGLLAANQKSVQPDSLFISCPSNHARGLATALDEIA